MVAGILCSNEERSGLLQHSAEVDRINLEAVDVSKTSGAACSHIGGPVYPNYQDPLRSYAEDGDSVASNSTGTSSADTMSSFYSDRSSLSDRSQRSDSLASGSSPSPSSGAGLANEQGYSASASGSGAALAVAPRRQFRHSRTRSGEWHDPSVQLPEELLEDRDASRTPTARRSMQFSVETSPIRASSKIRFAEFVEVTPIEEEEDSSCEEIAEEPVPEVPIITIEPLAMPHFEEA